MAQIGEDKFDGINRALRRIAKEVIMETVKIVKYVILIL